MAELLAELVAAPTLLGARGAGPGGHAPGVRATRPGAVRRAARPGRARARIPAARRSAGTSTARRTCSPTGSRPARRRPLADPQRPHRRRQPGAGRRCGAATRSTPRRRRRVDVRPRRGRHEVRASRRWSAPCAACSGSGLAPRAPVQLQSVVEEECTGNGALACVLAGHTADAAILTEPTRGAIWNAQVGVLWFQVRVLGAPAHAGDAPARRQRDRGVVRGDRGAARARGRAQRGQAAAVRRLSAPDQPQRRDDPRRRLAVDGRRRVRDPLPARAAIPGEPVADLKARVEQTVAASRPPSRASPHRGALRRLPVRGLRARARRAAGHRPARRRARARRASRRRCSPPPRRPTRARSTSTATRPRSASGRSPRASTASTSASTCRRSPRPRRRSRCSSPTGAGSTPPYRARRPARRFSALTVACRPPGRQPGGMTTSWIAWTTCARRASGSCRER